MLVSLVSLKTKLTSNVEHELYDWFSFFERRIFSEGARLVIERP